MSFTNDHLQRIARIAQAGDLSFVELVELAELDPGTAFQGAVMRGNMRGQDLRGFDFTGAEFRGCDLRGADLWWTEGITAEMLQGALVDEATRWPRALFWEHEEKPAWAERAGVDRYGPWVSIAVTGGVTPEVSHLPAPIPTPARGLVGRLWSGLRPLMRLFGAAEPRPVLPPEDDMQPLPGLDGTKVEQRLRWCPPGRFLMGSPPEEAGRDSDEGPQHEVTLQTGFWLFDTPCTQALWQAVMGNNPSRFKTLDRPVEQVSHQDAITFLQQINRRLPGLDLTLPSEAQWEYAARAGTTEATYAGDLDMLGECNAPVLDDIAWYGGNSGVGFDLDNGHDSSDWPEKQYDHTRAGTHPVGQKAANPWGLHDMLGNVWEWCADTWHATYEGAPTDGAARLGGGSTDRVIRGGSWSLDARGVRAAYRYWGDPTYRDDDLGFRCARVHSDSGAGRRRRGGGPGGAS